MSESQPGILAPVPKLSRYFKFTALPDADVSAVLRALADPAVDESAVVGF